MSTRQQRNLPAPASKKIYLYAAIAIVVIAAIAIIAQLNRAGSVPQAATDVTTPAVLTVGQVAPEFVVSTTNGPFDLATHTGPTFLEVFATWCPHCQREVPVLNALSDKYKGKIAFVSVSGSSRAGDGNSSESQADVISFATQLHVAYPIAYDPGLAVAKKYLGGGFPTMVLIDKNKKISKVLEGEVTQADLEKAIQAVL